MKYGIERAGENWLEVPRVGRRRGASAWWMALLFAVALVLEAVVVLCWRGL